jgi:glycosyltransferase involved in cell wall biosynthesis
LNPGVARVLLVSQHQYPAQPTLGRNVDELLDRGIQVDLVAIGSRWSLKGPGTRPGVCVYLMRQTQRRSPAFWYLIQYLTFFCWATAMVSVLSLRGRYDVVQVDTMPDFLVFATVVPRLRRIPIVLYIFDLVPEMTMDRFGVGPQDRRVWLAARLEVAAVRWATRVVTVSDLFCRALASRGLDARRVTIVPNSHPVVGFPPRRPPASPVLIMQTSLIPRYGVEIAIQALPILGRDWPAVRLRILGEGHLKGGLLRLARSLGIGERVSFSEGELPWRDAMNEVRQATIGIVPILSDGYGELILPNKIFELVALEVPVVCARLRGIHEHFPESTLGYFEPGNPRSLAEQVDRLLRDPAEASRQAQRARLAMAPLEWEQAAEQYRGALGIARSAAPPPDVEPRDTAQKLAASSIGRSRSRLS